MLSYKYLRANLRCRPLWMNILMLFCFFMAALYVPWDFFIKPMAEDEEVWFGILLTGGWAKATEPLHWLIYAAGAWGFWNMKSWLHPWALLYTLQIALGMFVWNLLDEQGSGIIGASVSAAPFIVLSLLLWRERLRFKTPACLMREHMAAQAE